MWQGRSSGILTQGHGVTAADFDEDGDLDIYVSNYRLEPNILWLNDGSGNFTNVTSDAGLSKSAADTSAEPGDTRIGPVWTIGEFSTA